MTVTDRPEEAVEVEPADVDAEVDSAHILAHKP